MIMGIHCRTHSTQQKKKREEWFLFSFTLIHFIQQQYIQSSLRLDNIFFFSSLRSVYVQNHFHTLSFPFLQIHRKISFISIFPETILKARTSRRPFLIHCRHATIFLRRVLSNFHNNSVRFEWLCKT